MIPAHTPRASASRMAWSPPANPLADAPPWRPGVYVLVFGVEFVKTL
jgi:hypothetical protein